MNTGRQLKRRCVRISGQLVTLGLLCVLTCHCGVTALAQPARGNDQATSKTATTASDGVDAAAKQRLLRTARWREAEQAFEAWCSVEVVYPPEELAEIREAFRRQVESASAEQLRELLDETQARMQVLLSEPAFELRAHWRKMMGTMAEHRVAAYRATLPRVAEMTSAQLEQFLVDFQHQQSADRQSAETFERMRQQQVQRTTARNEAERQAALARAYQKPAARIQPPPAGQSIAQRRASFRRYPSFAGRWLGRAWIFRW